MNDKKIPVVALISFVLPAAFLIVVILWLYFNLHIGLASAIIMGFLSLVAGSISIILGISGIAMITNYLEKYKGNWAAVTGIILGTSLIVLILIAFFIFINRHIKSSFNNIL